MKPNNLAYVGSLIPALYVGVKHYQGIDNCIWAKLICLVYLVCAAYQLLEYAIFQFHRSFWDEIIINYRP